jgi:hypothetical protein
MAVADERARMHPLSLQTLWEVAERFVKLLGALQIIKLPEGIGVAHHC